MLKSLIIIILASFFLATLWFKDGYIMGTAEGALPFYDLSRYLTASSFAWMEHPGLGNVTLNYTANKPTFFILTALQNFGWPTYIIEALVFFFLLAGSGIGIYFLTKELFPKLPEKFIFLSVVFYWFNPISLVDVWNRFLLNYMLFFALLPLSIFCFIRGIRTKKYYWLGWVTLVNGLFSAAFSYVAFDVLLWIIYVIVLTVYLLVNRDFANKLFYVKYIVLAFVLFTLTNLWWISQLILLKFAMGFESTIQNFDTEINLGILDALSKKMGNLAEIYRLSNASFFTPEGLKWARYLYSLPVVAIEFVVTGVIFFIIIKHLKEKSVLFLSILLFLSFFLVKGTNPPFGEIYGKIFERFSFLQVFRNPFEKFGFLLAVVVTPLFGVSIYKIVDYLPKKIGFISQFFLFGFVLFLLGYPFYTGVVFTGSETPTNDYSIGYKVKVPEYYALADKWMSSQGNNFRYIGFPLAVEGITYNWEKGYSGVDLSSTLFSTPGILFNTAVPYYFQIVKELENDFMTKDDFYKIAGTLNIKYYFVRNDIDFQKRAITNPVEIEKRLQALEKLGYVKKDGVFGKLTFWENLKWSDQLFYPATITLPELDNPKMSNALLAKDDSGPGLSYERYNPTKYKVHIKSASKPFLLVFSELFNSQWKARIGNQDITKHFLVNSFANGWWVQKQGDFDLEISFAPQKWMDVGELISGFTYIVLLPILAFITLRRNIK